MGRFLVMWETDESKIPIDPAERKAGWLGLIEMTKQDIKKGLIKDWGVFLGRTKGFNVLDGTEEEVLNTTLKYIPFIRFKVYNLLSIEKLEEGIKAM